MKRLLLSQVGQSRILIISLTSIAVITAAVLGFFLHNTEEETIKIGAILSLSGSGSHVVDLRDAMLMAAEEVNSRGGVNGRKIELLIEDSKTNPEEGKKAFERLENGSKKPLVYLSTHSTVGMALVPFAAKYKVVLIGANTSAPEFIEDNSWVFRHFINAAEEGRSMAQILSDLKLNSLGILYLDDPYGNSLLSAFEEQISDKNIKVTKTSFQKGVKDLTPMLEPLQGAQGIYIIGFVNQVALAIQELRQINYKGAILTASSGANPKITGLSEAESIYTVAPIVYNSNYPFAKTFKKKFETRFNKPLSHQAANGYDFVKIFAGLLEGQEVSRERVKHLFDQGFMYSGVLGDQELQKGDQEIVFPLHSAQIIDGKITFLKD